MGGIILDRTGMPNPVSPQFQAVPHERVSPAPEGNHLSRDQVEIAGTERKSVVYEHPNVNANFQYDKNLRQLIITLHREDTGEVIREIPPEQIRDVLKRIVETVDNMLDLRG